MRGAEVRFLVGVDENAQKNVEAALRWSSQSSVHSSQKNTRIIVQKYVDEMAAKWAST